MKKNSCRFFYRKSIYIIAFFLLASCSVPKKILYLQDVDGNTLRTINQQYTTKLQPDDVLNIVISSKDNLGTMPFNITSTTGNIGATNLSSQPRLLNYIVRQDGTIEFPVLGKIQIAGKTILETIDYLKGLLKPYINDPIVVIEWLNFKFTVLGEVRSPGLYRSTSERVSVLDALGMAGDLTIYGKRKDILLIRETNGKQKSYRLDITDKKFLESEVYYLKQNDVIIVSPNKAQSQSSIFRNTGMFVSMASLLISTITGIVTLSLAYGKNK
jgi:polysaccharide export outer membrane protein